MSDTAPFKPRAPKGEPVYRHRVITRISHWINVLCLSVLLMSGLNIFNAHPHLYWGQYGANFDKPVMEMVVDQAPDGSSVGVTRIGGHTFKTMGLFGASKYKGEWQARGFPGWMTLPSYQDLATGRHWHFFFAWLFVLNGLVYLVHTVWSGHLKKDLLPREGELKPRALLLDVWNHIRLKHPTGEAAKRYNPLQKLAYLGVIFLLLPLMILTGLTMSPGFNAIAPVLLDIFGGRQSARTLHFITANLLLLFVLVHLIEVLIAGVWNEVRSMITGWYVAQTEPKIGEPS